MSKFAEYIEGLSLSVETIDWVQFLLNLLITAVLCYGLMQFYVHFGKALSNRKKFARNFLPLGLTTMLIIYIVKSSVALSLGLVGALSIVRFRAAIKDPEELTYLFLTIGIGLAAGANQVMISVVATVSIITILFLQHLIANKVVFRTTENMHLNIRTTHKELKSIVDVLKNHFPFVELKRVDDQKGEMSLAFLIEAENVDQIETVKSKLKELDGETSVSFVEHRNIAV